MFNTIVSLDHLPVTIGPALDWRLKEEAVEINTALVKVA
jgi:hypothetical protein